MSSTDTPRGSRPVAGTPVGASSSGSSSIPGPAAVAAVPPPPVAPEVPRTGRRKPGDPLPTAHVGPIRRFFLRHPRVMDALVMAWFGVPALGTALVLAAPYQDVTPPDLDGQLTVSIESLPWGPTYAAIAVTTAVIGTAALWWRRQRPVLVFAIEVVLGVATMITTHQTGGFEYAVAFALYALAAVRGSRAAWIGFAVSGVLLATTLIVSESFTNYFTSENAPPEMSPGAFSIMVWSVVSLAVLIPSLVALAIGVSVNNRRRYVAELMDRADLLSLEQVQREQLAVSDERARIARELHDVVAHSLTVMITLAEGAAGIAERDPARAAAVMRDVAQTGRDSLADTRRVVGVLRSEGDLSLARTDPEDASAVDGSPSSSLAPDDGVPLAPAPTEALDDLIARFRTAGLSVSLTRNGPDLPVDNALRLTVFRIVQEALTNVLRYAPLASTIAVTVTRDPEAVAVEVINSAGPGIRPPAPGSGRGLIGMRERVAVFGGRLESGPTTTGSPGGPRTTTGWRIAATLPWKDPA
ncbi:sensor histidine kinase [Salana multivorans]